MLQTSSHFFVLKLVKTKLDLCYLVIIIASEVAV